MILTFCLNGKAMQKSKHHGKTMHSKNTMVSTVYMGALFSYDPHVIVVDLAPSGKPGTLCAIALTQGVRYESSNQRRIRGPGKQR